MEHVATGVHFSGLMIDATKNIRQRPEVSSLGHNRYMTNLNMGGICGNHDYHTQIHLEYKA